MKKLNSKDLINIGVFSALYIILCIIVSGLVLTPLLQMLMLPMMAIVSAPVYLLYVAKVGKFGAISITGLLFSSLVGLLVYGNVFCFLGNLAFFIIADLVALFGGYKSNTLNLLSFIFAVFSGIAEAGLPWIAGEYFHELSVASGYSEEWANGVDALATPTTLILMIVATIVCAIIGSIFSKIMFKKHFKKAGIV